MPWLLLSVSAAPFCRRFPGSLTPALLILRAALAAAGVQEFDFSLLTGTYCNNNACASWSTQVTSSSLWASASAATATAVGATFATLFRALFALTLVPVVLLSALEAVRWLSVYQLPVLPIDL